MIHIQVIREKLRTFFRGRHIRWMACFGSAVSDVFGPDGDVSARLIRGTFRNWLQQEHGGTAPPRRPGEAWTTGVQ